jgi:hypothetical protein
MSKEPSNYKRKSKRIRAAGSVPTWIALMPKSVKGLERRYKRNESLRENCDYKIINRNFPFIGIK